MASRSQKPQSLKDLTQYLSDKFRETYLDDKKKLNASCNPSRYFGSNMFKGIDAFRDELCTFSNPDKFSFTTLGDEIKPKEDDSDIGMKRKSGLSDDSPLHKKQKLDNNKNIDSKMDIDDLDD